MSPISGTMPPPRPMVNWDVVSQKLAALTADARQMWDDFTRQMTGPP